MSVARGLTAGEIAARQAAAQVYLRDLRAGKYLEEADLRALMDLINKNEAERSLLILEPVSPVSVEDQNSFKPKYAYHPRVKGEGTAASLAAIRDHAITPIILIFNGTNHYNAVSNPGALALSNISAKSTFSIPPQGIVEIKGDGNCAITAIQEQLSADSAWKQKDAVGVRAAIAGYLEEKIEQDPANAAFLCAELPQALQGAEGCDAEEEKSGGAKEETSGGGSKVTVRTDFFTDNAREALQTIQGESDQGDSDTARMFIEARRMNDRITSGGRCSDAQLAAALQLEEISAALTSSSERLVDAGDQKIRSMLPVIKEVLCPDLCNQRTAAEAAQPPVRLAGDEYPLNTRQGV
jgi:hypothetical protein